MLGLTLLLFGTELDTLLAHGPTCACSQSHTSRVVPLCRESEKVISAKVIVAGINFHRFVRRGCDDQPYRACPEAELPDSITDPSPAPGPEAYSSSSTSTTSSSPDSSCPYDVTPGYARA